jgi:hypothetical protein
MLSISIEEWLYLGERPVSTPHEVHLVTLFLVPIVSTPITARFVVVLNWQSSKDQGTPWRDVGPSFAVDPSFAGSRAEALNLAKRHATDQAKRLNAVGPFGFLPAREITK